MIGKRESVIELISVFMIWMFILVFRSNIYLVAGPFLFLVFWVLFGSPIIHKDTLEERGLGSWKTLFIVRTDNLKQAAKYALLLVLLVLSIMIPVGVLLRMYNVVTSPYPDFLVIIKTWVFYVPWAFLQQTLFLGFYAVRFQKLGLKDEWVILLTSIVFGLHHLPNWPLMLATFTIELFLAYCFLKAPNLFMYSIVHGLGGTLYGTFAGLSLFVGWG